MGRAISDRPPPRPLWADDAPIRVGISSCLLGRKVRFDGGHKRDRFLTDVLAPYVDWVPVCPEVELGMGIPRESIRLVRREGELRLVAERSGKDHTRSMERFASRRVRELEPLDLCGYVLKKDSPSCGMERVRVYGEKGMPRKEGRGVFADALLRGCALLPVEEEGRLNDPRLRDNWIERLFAYRRLRTLFGGRWRRGDVIAFHTAHKLQLMAHSPDHYRRLGRLVAEVKRLSRADFRQRYEAGFMEGLAQQATRRRNVNVLQHAAGHFRGRLDPTSSQELRALVDDYRGGLVPLVVPITLVRHHVRRLGVEYLAGQVYLEPHPKELMLRNHV